MVKGVHIFFFFISFYFILLICYLILIQTLQETQDTILNLRENIISAGENLDTGRVSLQPDSQYLNQLGLVPSSYSRYAGILYSIPYSARTGS